jgi:hypothetical protein
LAGRKNPLKNSAGGHHGSGRELKARSDNQVTPPPKRAQCCACIRNQSQ